MSLVRLSVLFLSAGSQAFAIWTLSRELTTALIWAVLYLALRYQLEEYRGLLDHRHSFWNMILAAVMICTAAWAGPPLASIPVAAVMGATELTMPWLETERVILAGPFLFSQRPISIPFELAESAVVRLSVRPYVPIRGPLDLMLAISTQFRFWVGGGMSGVHAHVRVGHRTVANLGTCEATVAVTIDKGRYELIMRAAGSTMVFIRLTRIGSKT